MSEPPPGPDEDPALDQAYYDPGFHEHRAAAYLAHAYTTEHDDHIITGDSSMLGGLQKGLRSAESARYAALAQAHATLALSLRTARGDTYRKRRRDDDEGPF